MLLQHLDLGLEVLVLFHQLPPLLLDLIGVLDGLIHKDEACVGAFLVVLDGGDVLPEDLILLLQVRLESFDVTLLPHLVVRLLHRYLPPQLLNFPPRFILNSLNVVFFPFPPDLVEVLKELIHQGLGHARRALVSKVMGQLEGFFWDPVFHFIARLVVFELTLLLGVMTASGLSVRIHESNIGATVLGELADLGEFLGLAEHLDEPLIVHLVVLYFQQCSPFSLPLHHNLIQLLLGLDELLLELLDLEVFGLLVLFQMPVFCPVHLLSHGDLGKDPIFLLDQTPQLADFALSHQDFPLEHIELAPRLFLQGELVLVVVLVALDDLVDLL
mmetsp:Transcript_23640/g.23356  ORF Transcript_23640/g.23356 Transcript_23640/m.23356 type:complete len:329 (-) Transcript_23640:402-1388(-)